MTHTVAEAINTSILTCITMCSSGLLRLCRITSHIASTANTKHTSAVHAALTAMGRLCFLISSKAHKTGTSKGKTEPSSTTRRKPQVLCRDYLNLTCHLHILTASLSGFTSSANTSAESPASRTNDTIRVFIELFALLFLFCFSPSFNNLNDFSKRSSVSDNVRMWFVLFEML